MTTDGKTRLSRWRPTYWTAITLSVPAAVSFMFYVFAPSLAGAALFQHIGQLAPYVPAAASLIAVSVVASVLAELPGGLHRWLGKTTTSSIRGVLRLIFILSLIGLAAGEYLLLLSVFVPLLETPTSQFSTLDFVIVAIVLAAPVLFVWLCLYGLAKAVTLDMFGVR